MRIQQIVSLAIQDNHTNDYIAKLFVFYFFVFRRHDRTFLATAGKKNESEE